VLRSLGGILDRRYAEAAEALEAALLEALCIIGLRLRHFLKPKEIEAALFDLAMTLELLSTRVAVQRLRQLELRILSNLPYAIGILIFFGTPRTL